MVAMLGCSEAVKMAVMMAVNLVDYLVGIWAGWMVVTLAAAKGVRKVEHLADLSA